MKRTIKGIFAGMVLGMMLTSVISAQSVVTQVNPQDACISKYTALIASAPKNDENYAERSRCYYLKSNDLRTSSNGHTAASDAEIELALADAQKAIDLNPKNTNALNVRGIVKSYKNDEIGARVDFDRVIEIDPRAFKAYMNRGLGKNRLKDYAGAIADYTKVIEIATPMSSVYSERGISYSNLGKKTEAIADLNKALQLDPKNKQATDTLAKLNGTVTTTPSSNRCVSGNCVNGKGKLVYDNEKTYEGDFVNSKFQGQGTFTAPNGDVYTGQFANNANNGQGKYKFANGYVYEGTWVNGKEEGQGTLTFPNGNYYVGRFENNKYNGYGKLYSKSTNTVQEGTWKNDILVSSTTAIAGKQLTFEGGEKYDTPPTNAPTASPKCLSGNCVDGNGKYIFSNGDVYEGTFVNRKAEGQGTFTTNGDVYIGQFANGHRNGKGKTKYASGVIYEGDWVNDKRAGQGTQIFPKGDVYTGQFADGRYNGKGKYKFVSGQTYEGNWVNDKKEGQGTQIFPDGRVYIGQFANGKYNGKGKYKYVNGDIYEGDFVDDNRVGNGTYTKPDGNYYVGEWKNNKQDGFGKQYYKATGKVVEGNWKDNVFVDSNAKTSLTTDQRIAELTKKIAASPKNDDLYVERGVVYYDKLDYKSALTDADKALQINPENEDAMELKDDAEWELDSDTPGSDMNTSASKTASEPQKTAEEWQKIAVAFREKIEDAVEKKKDDELAIKIYGEFDQATNGGRDRPQVQYIRRQMLRVMFQKGGIKLTSFVLKEMDKLNYTKEDRYVVFNSAIFV